MVATVTAQPSVSFQAQNTAGPAEVRARNDQTQPRTAPAADSQNAEQRNLRSRDDESKQETKRAEQRSQNSFSAQQPGAEQRRGSRLDIVA